MSEHTPGPWEFGQIQVLGNAMGQEFLVREVGDAKVNNEVIAFVTGPEEQRDEYARLIAAAPQTKKERDMLFEALDKAYEWFCTFGGDVGEDVPARFVEEARQICEAALEAVRERADD